MKIFSRSLHVLLSGLCAFADASAQQAADTPADQTSVIIVRGAGGEKDYDEAFADWSTKWSAAAAKGEARVKAIGSAPEGKADIDALRAALREESAEGAAPLWLVLLGHGTSDGQAPKFNLRGEDLTAAELAEWLAPMRRPVIVVAAFSSSGAFLAPLSASGRVLVTATKSGSENNYARFGKYLSQAIADRSSDRDHDGQTSVLEAWLRASQLTADFYTSEGRLATEHSLLDDNGDGRGTPASWFEGLRVVKKTTDGAAPDGLRAHQLHLVPSLQERELSAAKRRTRDELEAQVAALRARKSTLPEEQYFAELEALMLRIGRIYRKDPTPGND